MGNILNFEQKSHFFSIFAPSKNANFENSIFSHFAQKYFALCLWIFKQIYKTIVWIKNVHFWKKYKTFVLKSGYKEKNPEQIEIVKIKKPLSSKKIQNANGTTLFFVPGHSIRLNYSIKKKPSPQNGQALLAVRFPFFLAAKRTLHFWTLQEKNSRKPPKKWPRPRQKIDEKMNAGWITSWKRQEWVCMRVYVKIIYEFEAG